MKYDKDGKELRLSVDIKISDAKRIVEALEFDASWDKTEIYYQLKEWLEKSK